MPSTLLDTILPLIFMFFIKVNDVRDAPLALAFGRSVALTQSFDGRFMLDISVLDTNGRGRLVRKGESMTPKLLTEADATEQLDRIAPDWPLHLYDSGHRQYPQSDQQPAHIRYKNHAALPCPPCRLRLRVSRRALTGCRQR